jgi:uncharacterized protein (TIGR04255 family)
MAGIYLIRLREYQGTCYNSVSNWFSSVPEFNKVAMSPSSRFTIDFNQKFPILDRSPSIEAVIHWQANPSKVLDPTTLETELVRRLPNYPICEPQHGIEIAFGTPDGSSEVSHRTQWNGFRIQDEKHHVAQFTPVGAVFSRLEPYETWESFQSEAMRFWDIFLEIAMPITIQRLGVRYINRISLKSGEKPSKYLQITPSALADLELPTESFFYQDTYQIPGYPYHVNWVRTVQPQQTSSVVDQNQALIVDIDVFTTTELIASDRESLIKHLQEMRWIKNKIFFSCITQTAAAQFGA